MDPSSHTIAIIGAGSVGSAIAESILLRRVVADVILVDIDEERCRGQVLDLNDVACLSGSRVRQGTYKDASHAAVIVISAGAKQNPRDTRLDLIERNLKILKAVLEAMIPIRNDAILLIVANPVDILTFFAQRLSGLPRNQVLGSGTLLDSIRLRGIIASRLGVSETAVNAHVIGEHGDSQCVAWSSVNVSCLPISSILPLDLEERSAMAIATKQKAYDIIKIKGFTSWGIGAVTYLIYESIIFDQRQVLPLSHRQNDLQCCSSLPAVLGRSGLTSTLTLRLTEKEAVMLQASATNLKGVIQSYSV